MDLYQLHDPEYHHLFSLAIVKEYEVHDAHASLGIQVYLEKMDHLVLIHALGSYLRKEIVNEEAYFYHPGAMVAFPNFHSHHVDNHG